MDRIIVLVDMDCFYVQVEERLQPQYQGKPCAVVQYNGWRGGGIIAVNYEARHYGVTRGTRGDKAQEKCPDIHLFKVPEVRGKADLTRYRDAGAQVIEVLSTFSDCVERASIDEAYLDLTSTIASKLEDDVTPEQLPQTYVVGWENKENTSDYPTTKWLSSVKESGNILDRKLALAAVIVEEMRSAVFAKTQFRCSAGIAHNKMLAKLACGIHKPNRQTIFPRSSVSEYFKMVPIHKIRNLGGKLGDEIKEKLGIEMMSELGTWSERNLKMHFGDKTGNWLYNVAQGIENEVVIPRQLPKSIGCGKNFPGKSALNTKEKVRQWLHKLAEELSERLIKDQENNKRLAKIVTISVRSSNDRIHGNISRSCQIKSYDVSQMAHDIYCLLEKINNAPSSSPLWVPPLLNLSLSASKFQDSLETGTTKIQNYFGINSKSPIKIKTTKTVDMKNEDINTDEKEISNENDCNENTKNILSKPINNVNNEIRKDEVAIKKGFFATKFEEWAKTGCTMRKNRSESDDVSVNNLQSGDLLNIDCDVTTEVPKCAKEKTEPDNKKLSIQKELNNINTYFDVQSSSANCLNDLNETKEGNDSNSNENIPEAMEEFKEKCKKCGKLILTWEFQEHEDYHIALALQNETEEQTKCRTENTSVRKQQQTKKRTHTKTDSTTKKRKNDMKTMEYFFKK